MDTYWLFGYTRSTAVVLAAMMTSICALASWCDYDTGYATITDTQGHPHNVYISVSRDGGVWLRAGLQHRSAAWTFRQEFKQRYVETLLTSEELNVLSSVNYTGSCVLTDLTFELRMDNGWHPSFLKVYNTFTNENNILIFKHSKNCQMNTSLTLTRSKQELLCSGGVINACGLHHLPDKDQLSGATDVLSHVTFDPEGLGSVTCQQPRFRNSFTFTGSYYHVYAKLAACPAPTDSRQFGHEAKLRPHRDVVTNHVIIPDPRQRALSAATIIGWHLYAKQMSPQHTVYLQVWRPQKGQRRQFYLVGETRFSPAELRFQEVPLAPESYLSLSANDVLGLYYPHYNPLPYTTVPCARDDQRYIFIEDATRVAPGEVGVFSRAPAQATHACRQYSFTAILANKSSSKLIDDWLCPRTQQQQLADLNKRRTNSQSKTGGNSGTSADASASDVDDYVVPVNYILLIMGGLILFMLLVGVFSYYRAIKD